MPALTAVLYMHYTLHAYSLYLACDSKTLALCNLSQQLLAPILFFLILINFSFQFLKLQIL